VTGEEVPVYLASFVGEFHTGAVMGVPAHDHRDWNFAKAHQLPAKLVMGAEDSGIADLAAGPYTKEGVLTKDNGEFSGLKNSEAITKITELVTQKKLGKVQPNVRLRDWLVSRQRYWGTPIPIVHCEGECKKPVPVPEEELPVILPPKINLTEKSDFCKSPLAHQHDWVNTKCPV